MQLSLESMAWLRAKQRPNGPNVPFAECSPADSDGIQKGVFLLEPRITFTVQNFSDGREEKRDWFLDGESVASLDDAIKSIRIQAGATE